MSYRSVNVQAAYGNAGSNRAARQGDNCDDEGSQQMGSGGSRGEATSGYYEEESVSSMSRQRGGSEGYPSGQSGAGYGHSSSGNFGGSSTGDSGIGQSGSCGNSFGGHSGGNRGNSGGYAGASSGGYRASSSGHGSGSSGPRVGFTSSSSSISRSGGGSFSNRSTGGYSNRSSGGHQGFDSGFSGVSGNWGFGCFAGVNAFSGQRGGFSTGSLSGGEGLLQAGEKETMQNLNSRLSTYMDKVRALEDSNSEFEDKIRCWYETNKPQKVDNSKYYDTIEDIKNKVMRATIDHNKLTVDVDNAKLAADDFRLKYESELAMRRSVESDIDGLRKVLDDLTLEKASLESQIETLKEEIACDKRNHEQEMKSFQGQTSDVNVQVDAAPGINILKIINDMRAQYEDMAEENRRKAEQEFNQKITELSNEISNSSTEIETGKSEVTELRRCMQTMEIDLQSQLAMKSSLENTLAETQGRYASQLAQLQDMVSKLEEQLSEVRSDMENQACEYKLLLDIKTRLENEIEMYRRLLDGGCGSSSGFGSGSGSGSSSTEWSSRQDGKFDSSSMTDPKRNRVVTKITEERVDGRLVSTKIDKIEPRMC